MLQIDLEKAVHRVQVLYKILAHIGVGKIIPQGVKMSHTNCHTSLKVNNSVTEKIPLQFKSFVRQRHLPRFLPSPSNRSAKL